MTLAAPWIFQLSTVVLSNYMKRIQTSRKAVTIATVVDAVLSILVLIGLVGIHSQPNSGGNPAGILLLPILLFAAPWTVVWLWRALTSSALSSKERVLFSLVLLLATAPYVWYCTG